MANLALRQSVLINKVIWQLFKSLAISA